MNIFLKKNYCNNDYGLFLFCFLKKKTDLLNIDKYYYITHS